MKLINNIADLINIKSIVTLSLIGCLIFLVIKDKISAEAFMGVLSSVITYYFTRKEKGKDELD